MAERPEAKPGHRGSELALELGSCRLLIVGGKGGVGKTTVSGALAVREAATRRTLLLSTDPAHSLGDMLGRKIGDAEVRIGKRLWARELDAQGAMARRRVALLGGVDTLFEGLRRQSVDLAFDREILADLVDMTPPGMDELMALLEMVEVTRAEPRRWDVVVLDSAPSGHTLRLLAMPQRIVGWAHALLEICLKYRRVVGLGGIAADLLQLSQELRGLTALLVDPAQTRFIPTVRPARLPIEETADVLDELCRLHIPLGPLVVNGVVDPRCDACQADARAQVAQLEQTRHLASRFGIRRFLAPLSFPPPSGVRGLAAWSSGWRAGVPRR